MPIIRYNLLQCKVNSIYRNKNYKLLFREFFKWNLHVKWKPHVRPTYFSYPISQCHCSKRVNARNRYSSLYPPSPPHLLRSTNSISYHFCVAFLLFIENEMQTHARATRPWDENWGRGGWCEYIFRVVVNGLRCMLNAW